MSYNTHGISYALHSAMLCEQSYAVVLYLVCFSTCILLPSLGNFNIKRIVVVAVLAVTVTAM